ncbi:MAG: hypothetical protein II967_00275 [Deltaproteobacteria bacterium]|nr:hypothetical protein [Deltaproteobacteria bacterium]
MDGRFALILGCKVVFAVMLIYFCYALCIPILAILKRNGHEKPWKSTLNIFRFLKDIKEIQKELKSDELQSSIRFLQNAIIISIILIVWIFVKF